MGDLRQRKTFARGLLTFVPVPADDQQRRVPMSMHELSLWQRCKSWLQYHSIQLRWHIERSLARRFNRRWGG